MNIVNLKASASAAMCLLYLKNHSTVANCFIVMLWSFSGGLFCLNPGPFQKLVVL